MPPISCRLEVLPGEHVADQLSAARRFGFDGVALPGRFLNCWLRPIRECVADSPVALAGISLGFRGSLLSESPVERNACRDSLLKLMDLAAELDARWINMPPCLLQDNANLISDAGEYPSLRERLDNLLLEQLPGLGDAARDRKILLLLEPVNRYESHYLNSILHAARLCEQLNHPAIGCTADFFHMQLEELNTGEALRQARPAVRHIHVAENTRVEPGPGSLDFKPGFAALKQNAYAGWIEIECRRLSGPADEVLPRSADYLRKKWNEA
ncbi:TIM barrel protein [bacterium]|nr:TIM barrel protein [bacterium]